MTGDPIIHHAFNIPFSIGSHTWPFTGFGIAVFLAFLISQVVTEHELRGRNHETEALAVGDVLLGAIGGTLIGAKIYYITVLPTTTWQDFFTRGGFVYWGGFMGAVIACFLIIKFKKLSFARYADVAGLAIPAGYAVGRTGCWAVGDDYGMWYDGPLAVSFPEGAPALTVANMMREFGQTFPSDMKLDAVVSVIPTQLIEVVLGFIMFMVLWRMRRHTHAEGWMFGAYCALAGIERFIVEFMRAKDDRFLGISLSVAQLIAIGIFVVGVVIMKVRADGRQGPIMGAPLPAAA